MTETRESKKKVKAGVEHTIGKKPVQTTMIESTGRTKERHADIVQSQNLKVGQKAPIDGIVTAEVTGQVGPQKANCLTR